MKKSVGSRGRAKARQRRNSRKAVRRSALSPAALAAKNRNTSTRQ